MSEPSEWAMRAATALMQALLVNEGLELNGAGMCMVAEALDAERARCLAHVRSAHRKWGNLTIGYQQAERAIESGEPADA